MERHGGVREVQQHQTFGVVQAEVLCSDRLSGIFEAFRKPPLPTRNLHSHIRQNFSILLIADRDYETDVFIAASPDDFSSASGAKHCWPG